MYFISLLCPSHRHQNIRFLHSRSIFSVEFFNFIKKLVSCNIPSARSDKIVSIVLECFFSY